MIRKVIVILGQTATGKSALAIKISKKFHGEVISADSRQIYKGLDIGTGKITKKEMRGVPHYLLDIANPKSKFTVAEYQKLANKKIVEIFAREKIPIICGGTGFYIDAVTKGIIFPEVPPNKKLRQVLTRLDNRKLLLILKKLDKVRAKNIDKDNKIRLIRAIEIAKHLGKVPSLKTQKPSYQFIQIGLYLPQVALQKKIEKRVKNMFDTGLLKEVKKLKSSGLRDKRLRELGFEYFKPTYENVVAGTLKYAKRQMTWFKRDKSIKWFEPKEYKKIEKYIKSKV